MNGHIAVAHSFSMGDIARSKEFVYRTAQFIQRLPYVEELRPAYVHIQEAYQHDKNVKEALSWGHILEQKARARGDLRGQATALRYLGRTRVGMGDLSTGLDQARRSLELYTRIGDTKHQAWTLRDMTWALLHLGDQQLAEGHWKRYLETAQAAGLGRELAIAYELGGLVSLCRGRWEEAVARFEKGLSLHRELGISPNQGWIHIGLGQTYLARKDCAQAAKQFQRALDLLRDETSEQVSFGIVLPLSGLESAQCDGKAFRAFCRRFRQELPQASKLSSIQWYLEPAGARADVPSLYHDNFVADLAPEWTWHDPFGDCSYSVGNGLEIKTVNGRGLWGINQSAPRLLRPAEGDLAIQTVCAPASDRKPATGGLLIWKDKRNYLWLDRGTFGAQDAVFVGRLDNVDVAAGRGRLPIESAAWTGRVFLRLEREEGQVSALCSIDGESWSTVGQAAFPVKDPVQIGLFACGVGDLIVYPGLYPEGTATRFESFELWAGAE
jgi:tetratricopeptide (TPR) repeat protein/regulation of enolase protein 1 (concanavalin A-like superfamily)